MLIHAFMTDCRFMVPTRVSDGEGGSTTTWRAGNAFRAAIALQSSTTARAASHDVPAVSYTITTPLVAVLKFHDVIRRESDGAIFRVTSSAADNHTPNGAGLDLAQVTAERWEVPG